MLEKIHKRNHFLAFFGRVLLMAYIPAYLMRVNQTGFPALMWVWMAIIVVGAVLMLWSAMDYYRDRRGDHRLMLLDGAYVFAIFLLVAILPFSSVVNAFIGETLALMCLMAMNFLFVKRWPPVGRKSR